MKRIILTSAGVLALTLMSFTNNGYDDKIIEVSGNTITVKDTRKISEKDLKFLSENVVGWSECLQYSTKQECNTKWKTFPDEPTTQLKIKEIIAKYNN